MLFKRIMLSGVLAAAVVLLVGSMAAAADVVGVVDTQKVIAQHPAYAETMKKIEQVSNQKKSEFMSAAEKEKDDAKKAQIFQTKQSEMAAEQQKLMAPIMQSCEVALRTVAVEKKVTVVLEKNFVLYGGQDLTEDVIQRLKVDSGKK